ncbi:hypothetical protein BDD12DRAFT_831676 [Trichophaea hybrida]|nr:hypothetical protein BDD12DRAFT_831676 [Trichophaea hybrida]
MHVSEVLLHDLTSWRCMALYSWGYWLLFTVSLALEVWASSCMIMLSFLAVSGLFYPSPWLCPSCGIIYTTAVCI